MADSVNVVNNDWSKEITLAKLLRATESGNNILEDYFKSVTGRDPRKAIKEQTTQDKANTKAITDAADTAPVSASVKRNTAALDAMRRELGNTFEQIGGQLSAADPKSMFGTFASNMKYSSRYLEDINGALPKLFSLMTGIIGVFATSYERLTDLNDAFVASYSAGVRFSDGIDGLNKAVGESGMTVQEFTGIMNRYSQAFNVLGGKDAVRLSREFRRITKSGSELMMTQSESQEALMTYADMLRLSGRLGKMSADSIAAGGKNFLESINELSEASGRSREEILRSTRDALAQPSFQAFMSGLDEIAQENLETGVASLAAFGADIQNEYKDMIVAAGTGGTAAMFKTNQNLMMLATQTGQLPKLMNIINLARAGQDTTVAMKEFYDGIKASNLVQSDQLNILAQFNPMYAGMRDEFGKLGMAANSVVDMQERAAKEGMTLEAYRQAMIDRSKKQLEADAALRQSMTTLNSAFNDLIIHAIYPVLIPAINTLATAINSVSVPLQMLGDFLSGMHSMLGGGGLADFATATVGIGGGVAGYKLAKGSIGLAGSMGKGLLSTAGSMLGMPKGPSIDDLSIESDELEKKKQRFDNISNNAEKSIGKVGRLGKSIGTFIGSIGKGLGSAIGGLIEMTMKGIAAGLAAFAKGPVIAGAASLAGSIALIGGAVDLVIGGFGVAMMAIGKGLDMVGGSLVKFNDIDGANLGEVGKGMALLGAGMAAMGAGEVVSAWGSIVDGVMYMFKADVKTKLLEYAGIGEPLKAGGEGLSSFATSFRSAVDMLNNVSLSDSVGTTFDQIKGFLGTDMGGFFGGAPAVIGQVNQLAESIGNLAQKTIDFQEAQNSITVNPSMPAITTDELQKRTLQHYDDQKRSNSSMITLLKSANDKLDTINGSIGMQTTDFSRAMRDAGRIF